MHSKLLLSMQDLNFIPSKAFLWGQSEFSPITADAAVILGGWLVGREYGSGGRG